MGVVGKIGGRAMPPGFYYKTFMFPESMWMTYEKYIRKAAGLGKSPLERDPDRYETVNQHCDVLGGWRWSCRAYGCSQLSAQWRPGHYCR